MKRGGGNGGGAGSDRAFGMGMELLEENEVAEMRVVGREYRRSKPGLGSYTRMAGGEVKRGMSMSSWWQVSLCHEPVQIAGCDRDRLFVDTSNMRLVVVVARGSIGC
jgi:hypothetical protein